jgi:S-DNA-T family DNA segregation ATPase FtsK/SpoIIIE
VAYLIDGYDRQLSEFETFGYVSMYTVECSEFEEIVQKFSDAAEKRMNVLRDGGTLDNEPLLLCVVQNSKIFDESAVPRPTSEQFKKLLGDVKQLKMCFIFTDVDNNPEYSPPDIMKIARDFSQYFLLDDIVNVELFGIGKFGSSELRENRKPISLGDGYSLDAFGSLERMRFVKCERGR